MHLYFRISACLKALAHDRRAGIAPIFGILLLPMLGIMGFAIDVSTMLAERTRAQNMADAGALDALRIAQSYMDTNGNTTSAFNQIQTTAQSNGVSFIQGLASQDKNMESPSSSVTLTFSNNSLTSNSIIKYNYQTILMGLFGYDLIPLESISTATQSLSKFTQVIFLIDVSGSMGVAATTGDMQNMINLTSALTGGAVPCAFACHQSPSGAWGYAAVDFRAYTKKAGIKSKIDYAVSAVEDFTTQLATASASAPGHFSTSIYTFGASLTTVQAPTTDFTNITTTIGNIDLELYDNCPGGTCGGWTYLTTAMQGLYGKLQNVGDGSSPTSMQTYIIMVTDGVEDIYNASAISTHQTDTSWVSVCSQFKSLGVNMATVQAQYPAITLGLDTINYTNLVLPIATQIAPAMQQCASSNDLALSASDGPGLQTAIDSLFAAISASPRLTN